MPVETALVVDDSKSARIMLSRMLQKTGLQVEMVESGEEAVEWLGNNTHPDVIFMDHMMPGMDGLETTKVITSNDSTQNIPILMYTSKEGPEYEAELAECGAYGMLGKPAKPDRLKALIEQINEDMAAAPSPVEEPAEAEEQVVVAEPATIDESPVIETTEQEPVAEEEEEMSKELIEEVSAQVVARALEDALQPIKDSFQRMETNIQENQSEIRKLSSRQASAVNMVTQPVLDASLKQTSVQMQNQLSNEVKSIRDLIEQRAELSPEAVAQIRELATNSGATAGAENAEKAATAAAEAVAAKVSAAQAQIQVQQDVQPFVAQVKRANTLAIVSLLIAGAAIALNFVL